MASFGDCIRNMIDADVITPDEARELNAAYERIRTQKAGAIGEAAADAAAQAEMLKRLEAEAKHKKRRALLAIAAQRRVKAQLDSFRDPSGAPDIGLAAINLLENYGRAGYSSVAGRFKSIVGMAQAELEGLLHEFRRTAVLGTRMNRPRLDHVVRELFGEATGDPMAGALARSWDAVSDGLRQRFNAAGGAIQKLERWGLPQSHDRRAVMKRGKEGWIADTLPRLDPARMVHPLTGEAIPPAELRSVLGEVWDSIVTEGWNRREPAAVPFGRGAVSNQRTDHRFLVFRSADDWLAYQGQFGQPDPFASMMDHINGMARDIAAMEVLGPNPAATVEWLKQTVQKETALAEAGKPSRMKAGRYPGLGMRATGNVTVAELEGLWSELRGGVGAASDTLAGVAAGIRNWLVASKLGGATLSAITGDPVTMAVARKFIGLPAVNTTVSLARQFRGAAQREAVAAGLINEEAMHVLREQARWAGSLGGPEWTRWLPDRVLAWNGLQAWTRAAKHSFGREMQAFLGNRLGDAWEALPREFTRAAEGYGLSAADWAVMQKAAAQDIEGARFLRPGDIAAVDDPRARDVAERWLEMILAETEYAIPSGTARGRALLIGNSVPGSIWGELRRSAAMFRSFSVSIAMTQGARLAAEVGGGRGARGAGYAGALVVSLTLGGALGMWLKQIAAGKDPQKPDSMDFWIAAMAQGGGLGIFGDFLFADYSRFGNGLASTILGPGVSAVEDVWKATGGQVRKAATGQETNLSEETLKLLRNYTPGGTIWYARTAYNRVLLDQLQHLTDPKANKRFKAQVQNARRERDQGFWWMPGEAAPDRLPAP